MSHTKKLFVLFIALLFGLMPTNVFALDEATLNFFAPNNIIFYDPDSNCVDVAKASDSEAGSSGAWSERLEWVVTSYGQLSMDLQREWGTPWEVVFAQMIKESSIGTAANGINKGVEKNGYYNWLGLTGKGGKYSVGTPYHSGRDWAQYATIDDMIRDYAGTYIARNGYYDKAFTHLDPNNYDLEGYLSDFILVYAPPKENDTTLYINQMMPYIRTIREIGAKQGWPSSEELAKQENIQPGGRHPIGQKATDDDTNGAAAPVQCSGNQSGAHSRSDVVGFSSVSEATEVLRKMYYAENLSGMLPNLSVPSTGDVHDNCVAFTQWFMIKFTSITKSGMTGSGNAIVYNYYNKFHEQFPGMTVTDYPTLYSIASWKSPAKWSNHTGVIVGIDGDYAIVAEAAWENHGMPFERIAISSLSGPGNYYVSIIDYLEPQGILK